MVTVHTEKQIGWVLSEPCEVYLGLAKNLSPDSTVGGAMTTAPGLCLFADFHPRNPRTLVYWGLTGSSLLAMSGFSSETQQASSPHLSSSLCCFSEKWQLIESANEQEK